MISKGYIVISQIIISKRLMADINSLLRIVHFFNVDVFIYVIVVVMTMIGYHEKDEDYYSCTVVFYCFL